MSKPTQNTVIRFSGRVRGLTPDYYTEETRIRTLRLLFSRLSRTVGTDTGVTVSVEGAGTSLVYGKTTRMSGMYRVVGSIGQGSAGTTLVFEHCKSGAKVLLNWGDSIDTMTVHGIVPTYVTLVRMQRENGSAVNDTATVRGTREVVRMIRRETLANHGNHPSL